MPSAVTVTKGTRGDFGWMFRLLSAVMSALAIVALARHAFVTWSLSAPMALVMDAYSATVRLLLGWAEPFLQAVLTWLGGLIGWYPKLYPHWRDVYVVIVLFVAASSRTEWRFGNPVAALVIGVIGGSSALISALVAGLLPLQSDSLTIQLIIAGSVSISLYLTMLFELMARSHRSLAFEGEKGPMASAAQIALVPSVVAVLSTWLLSYALNTVAGFGLVGLAASIFLVGVAALFFHWRHRALWVLGLTILGGFVGAFCFFAIDAGLKLLMG